ncbi:osteocalcin 2-like [Branchiostoma lanceolatum]|uniref:osteocalcin 2-like n=1 Tax=Branchiostoma lanceolatum TaxID=7740 RepID=UPI003455A53D
MGTTESKSEAKPGLMARLGCACILCPLKKLSRKRKVPILGEGSGGVRVVAPFKTPVSLEAESSEAESSEAESSEAESSEAESSEAESSEAESSEAESSEAESSEAESSEAESSEAESSEAESSEAESSEAESSEAESSEAESSEAESSEAESSEAESSDESHTFIPVPPLSALDTRMFSPDPAVMATTKSSTQGPYASGKRPKVIRIKVAEAAKENRDIFPRPCTPIDDFQCQV